MVALSFPNGVAVAQSDLFTAMQYLLKSTPKISAYCSLYGENSLTLDQNVIPFSASSANYSDSILQGWVESIAQSKSIPKTDCLIFINPQGPINSDADASQGVLGYHSITPSGQIYCFVNALGSGFTLDDKANIYAVSLSHEVAEMTVDPNANLSEPECCDPCAGNCNTDYRNYFDSDSNWISQSSAFPPTFPYSFFVEGIVKPPDAQNCPASEQSCVYSPP